MPINKSYGWKPELADHRDMPYMSMRPRNTKISLPQSRDLRLFMTPVYDQGNLGSCTANAIVAAVEYQRNKQNFFSGEELSRLFLYFNERQMEGTIREDAGAYIRDGVKSVMKDGICLETLWPYTRPFTELPIIECYQDALSRQALLYASVNNDYYEVCSAINDDYPVIFGFTVYESFESPETAKTGIMSLPRQGERIVGGHAVLAVGYSLELQHLIVRNSWGKDWGIEGYFYMPFSYLKLADDFWIIKSVE